MLAQQGEGHRGHGFADLRVWKLGQSRWRGAIWEVDRSAFEHCDAGIDAGGQWDCGAKRLMRLSVVNQRDPSHQMVSFTEQDGGNTAAAEPHRAASDRVEHRLMVRRR